MGRYEQAADVYRDAVRISPDDTTLQRQLGLALSLAEKNVEAVAVLEPLARKDKDTPGYILVALGRAYLGAGRPDDAKAILRTATKVSPSSLPAWTWLARAALSGNDLVTAREAAAKATEIGAGSPEPFILLGYVCLRQGHTSAAVHALQTALQKQPNDPLALYLLAQARQTRRPEPAPSASEGSAAKGAPSPSEGLAQNTASDSQDDSTPPAAPMEVSPP